MKFSTTNQNVLRQIVNKNQGVVEKLKNITAPWNTKKFIKQVEAEGAKTEGILKN